MSLVFLKVYLDSILAWLEVYFYVFIRRPSIIELLLRFVVARSLFNLLVVLLMQILKLVLEILIPLFVHCSAKETLIFPQKLERYVIVVYVEVLGGWVSVGHG